MDYHDPTAGIGGAPPARSALGLRFALALFGLALCTAIAVGSIVAGVLVLAGIFAFLAAVALVDLAVIVRRMRREGRRQNRRAS